jgi:hypothetical protein
MTRLSDTQSVILSAAASRANRALLPAPRSIRAKGKTLERSLRALLTGGLAEERVMRRADEIWRHGEDERALGLVATAKGLAAIGIEELAGGQGGDANADQTQRPRGKLETVLRAIEADAGATLEELVAATSWLPHTTRAAITRLRQRGFDIRLMERDGRRAYRLAA